MFLKYIYSNRNILKLDILKWVVKTIQMVWLTFFYGLITSNVDNVLRNRCLSETLTCDKIFCYMIPFNDIRYLRNL